METERLDQPRPFQVSWPSQLYLVCVFTFAESIYHLLLIETHLSIFCIDIIGGLIVVDLFRIRISIVTVDFSVGMGCYLQVPCFDFQLMQQSEPIINRSHRITSEGIMLSALILICFGVGLMIIPC